MITLLVADCGATSGKWVLSSHASGSMARFRTGPINVSTMSDSQVSAELADARKQCPVPPTIVRIYASGAIGAGIERLRSAAARVFDLPEENVTVESDLVGTARAVLAHRRGIACILGTGSNSCLWDGERIERHVPPMGYILGDEGSGAALGAEILRHAIRRLLPPELMAAWDKAYPGLTYPALVERVYREHAGGGYVASFVPFLAEHIGHPYIASLVERVEGRFFDLLVQAYPEASQLPIGLTGGIASTFAEQIRSIARERGLTITAIASGPLDLI